MATVSKILFTSKFAESTLTTQYITPSTAKTQIDKITAHNSSANNALLYVYLVPSGSSAGIANLLSDVTLGPGDEYGFPELSGHLLEPGSSIQMQASAASAISIRGAGREFS